MKAGIKKVFDIVPDIADLLEDKKVSDAEAMINDLIKAPEDVMCYTNDNSGHRILVLHMNQGIEKAKQAILSLYK